jgi:nicotinamidase-related amidase
MKKLLVIIDMVNGFVKYGALHDPKIGEITPDIIKLVQQFINEGQPIVSFQDSHTPDDPEFKIYPPHCVRGTGEDYLLDEFALYGGKIMAFWKTTTNAMEQPAIRQYFAENKFDEVIVTGCCTDICIQQFVLALLNFLKDTKTITRVIVPKNCVATFNTPNHEAKTFHDGALDIMKSAGVIIV